MARFVVALNEQYAGVAPDGSIDWIPAMRWAAMEVQGLNQYVGMLGLDPITGESSFPRPISCDPNAVVWTEEAIITVPETINVIPETTIRVSTGWIEEATNADTGIVTPRYETFADELVPGYEETIPEHDEIIPAHWAGQVEKIVGDLCTPPTIDGFITVDIENYEWINFHFLIQMPSTFFLLGGIPKHAGTII